MKIPIELEYGQMRLFLLKLGVPESALKLGDSYFALPTKAWVKKGMTKEYNSILKQLDYTYVPEMRDCDDHAMMASVWAKYFHAETVKAKRLDMESGLAFGVLWLASRSHALNMVVHWDAKAEVPQASVYEPQPNNAGVSFDEIIIEPWEYTKCALCLF